LIRDNFFHNIYLKMSKFTIQSALSLPNSKYSIPRLGLGVYKAPEAVTGRAVKAALEHGYRHIDTAQFYYNEAQVGEAVRELSKAGKLAREDVFITTKFMSPQGSVDKSYKLAEDSVKKIGLDYVDLFLIHSPGSGPKGRAELWLALEKLVENGLARNIGVSNFSPKHIEGLKGVGKIWPPAINQIEVCTSSCCIQLKIY
jgi:diketogulonate reductase-like aldo/keto reductase